MRRNGRAWIIAEVTVDIDDAGRHPFARRVDHRRAFGNREVAAADRLDPPVRQPDRATVDAPALAVEHGRAPDHRDVRRRRPMGGGKRRSEEHTSELQSLMRISYAVLCLKKKKDTNTQLESSKHDMPLTHESS